jgi:hypothetical protein
LTKECFHSKSVIRLLFFHFVNKEKFILILSNKKSLWQWKHPVSELFITVEANHVQLTKVRSVGLKSSF